MFEGFFVKKKNLGKTMVRKLVKMTTVCLAPFGGRGTKTLVIGLGKSAVEWV